MTTKKQTIINQLQRGDYTEGAKVYNELYGMQISRQTLQYFFKREYQSLNADRFIAAMAEAQRRRLAAQTETDHAPTPQGGREN